MSLMSAYVPLVVRSSEDDPARDKAVTTILRRRHWTLRSEWPPAPVVPSRRVTMDITAHGTTRDGEDDAGAGS